ncbi:MAG: 5-dehydro-4-deoxy-D-glucuronate isomerase [Verrucomicrobiota bacterium]
MELRHSVGVGEYKRMTTCELRGAFLVAGLFEQGTLRTIYWETDRAVAGSAVPLEVPLELKTAPELASDYFCERREMGIINTGGPGSVRVDGAEYPMEPLDCLYVGRGSREIHFQSRTPTNPARYFLMSYPAHAAYPTILATQKEANPVRLGSRKTANQRTIFQYIHENGIRSCQLVMGFTRLAEGSVWNTMPAHTHSRRSEVYLYFDVPSDAAVVHLMGPGDETRHLLVQDGQAVLSPAWSIHSGCGTERYSFIWAMGGENQRFDDMDPIPINELK